MATLWKAGGSDGALLSPHHPEDINMVSVCADIFQASEYEQRLGPSGQAQPLLTEQEPTASSCRDATACCVVQE